MRLGKASLHAVFAAIYIADHEQTGPVSGRQIAEACGIPAEYLFKILQRLCRVRVLESTRGRHGGFVLRQPADETTLLAIIEAIEGPLTSEPAVRPEATGVEPAQRQVETFCQELAERSRSLLASTTIKHLMGQPVPAHPDGTSC